MFFVYILINERREAYVGYTDNIVRRLNEHNDGRSGKNGRTHARGPWMLFHSEEFIEKSAAIKREKTQ